VVGKLITYHLEERPRVKIVDYRASATLDRSKIDDALREREIELRLDSFLEPGRLARIRRAIRDLLAEKGYRHAEVASTVTPLAGGPKRVNVTFTVTDGPKLAIRDLEFLGNRSIGDETLARAVKGNRPEGLLSLLTKAGTYNEARFAEDAQSIEDYYREHGYIAARVGEPELRELDDSADGATRWIQLRISVSEGVRYRVGTIGLEGNQLVPADVLRSLFKLTEGDWYDQSKIREGLEKAREIYGAAGYMEFTGYPDLTPRRVAEPAGDPGAPDPRTAGADPGSPSEAPIVDVAIRVTEGPQYVVHRITFAGNTTTRDSVIRRELRIVEGGIFDTEALKQSVRRLNQLEYFKPLEGTEEDLQVERSPAADHGVDVTLKLEEQNRNQLQFGAGMSQYEGFFGNLSFTTTNFLGTGESLTLTGQRGTRSSLYQIAFTEPYMFDRPLSAGVDLYSRKIDYLTGTDVVGYSEVRSGVNVTVGHALLQFSRGFLTYGYEVIDTAVSDDLFDAIDADAAVGVPVFNPFLDEGRHVESRLTPSFVHNTVDNPFAPRRGRRITASGTIAGEILGGTTSYLRPELEVVQYIPHTSRTALGLRANIGWVRPFGSTRALPYYQRFFLGGEYQIRGVDIRTVGPTDSQNRAIGGDKFVLFNAEYYVDLFAGVRVLAFHDAGQAFLETEGIDLKRLRTSSGVELRVVLPMLNMPFRLIYAWNVYRDAFQPARAFKFAVGTTF
jgi:outer membrane protein insertion porin family